MHQARCLKHSRASKKHPFETPGMLLCLMLNHVFCSAIPLKPQKKHEKASLSQLGKVLITNDTHFSR